MEPDPTQEMFDVLTADGVLTGRARPRSDVHRDGDWHRSFHCWLAWHGDDSRPLVLFQRRGPDKDTEPNMLDVAVGGHYRSGETLDQVVREVQEELGIPVALADLVPVGIRRAENVRGSYADREIQDVFVYLHPAGLADLRPAPDEITALYVVSVDDLERLFDSRLAAIPATRAAVGAGGALLPPGVTTITIDDFVPVKDRYWLRGAHAAARVLAGELGVGL